jgi:hypothetical protein
VNCLLTINIGDSLCPNARESLEAAAARWGCDFLEVRDNYVGQLPPHFNKVPAIRKRCLGYASVMCVDADVLIRSDAPNPFYMFTGERVYAVRDLPINLTAEQLRYYKADVTDIWVDWALQIIRPDVVREPIVATCHEWFFNSGVFVLRPWAVMSEIDWFIASMPQGRSDIPHRMEQALWNCVLHASDKVEFIGQEWNHVQPNVNDPVMRDFVYHFTGYDWPTMRFHLPRYNWKI